MTWAQFLFDAAAQFTGDLIAGFLLVLLAVKLEARLDEVLDQKQDDRARKRQKRSSLHD